ncbi:MAG: 30S ribosomal protein S17 [Candidatus Levybacteria bacterium CG10_big_fil_rev_8_21_14_0_10_35_13]|nr:MAG: 30S ribosomal protein S17 [Candidatus Levybacteria bacterium CG10_big_fil_rev_8_21_14_0_10_35_13]
MKKTIVGKIVSLKMNNTAIIEVTRRVAHPLYKKLLKKSKRYKADTNGLTLSLGDSVKIVSVRPISKEKNFKISEVIK